jgi:hypothetical protein
LKNLGDGIYENEQKHIVLTCTELQHGNLSAHIFTISLLVRMFYHSITLSDDHSDGSVLLLSLQQEDFGLLGGCPLPV